MNCRTVNNCRTSQCDASKAQLVAVGVQYLSVHYLTATGSNPLQMIELRFTFIFAENKQRLGVSFNKTSP